MMKRIKQKGMLLILLCVLLLPASAFANDLVDTFSGTEAVFGIPTSTAEKEIVTEDTVNHNRSKSAAYIPPEFGSMTSYTLNHKERLTPNLVDERVSKDTTGIHQLNDGAAGSAAVKGESSLESWYTVLTDELYYSAGHIGRLSIPEIDLSVKVYEGESQSNMKKGVAHMKDTSFWSGNVVLCGHNRGESNYFGEIHKLEKGDRIYYRTKLGEKVYEVVRVTKIHETNQSVLLPDTEDQITLLTCVRNESAYRYAVKAVRVE